MKPNVWPPNSRPAPDSCSQRRHEENEAICVSDSNPSSTLRLRCREDRSRALGSIHWFVSKLTLRGPTRDIGGRYFDSSDRARPLYLRVNTSNIMACSSSAGRKDAVHRVGIGSALTLEVAGLEGTADRRTGGAVAKEFLSELNETHEVFNWQYGDRSQQIRGFLKTGETRAPFDPIAAPAFDPRAPSSSATSAIHARLTRIMLPALSNRAIGQGNVSIKA